MVLRLFNRIVLSIMLNTSDLSKINKLSVKFCDAVSLSARSLVKMQPSWFFKGGFAE